MPKTTPVMMLKRPVKTSVEARSIEPCIARAIMRGSKVPRSPRAPEISAAGDARSVRTLCRLRRASSEMNAGRCIFIAFVLLWECILGLDLGRRCEVEVGVKVEDERELQSVNFGWQEEHAKSEEMYCTYLIIYAHDEGQLVDIQNK
jgi:hypothetical protein